MPAAADARARTLAAIRRGLAAAALFLWLCAVGIGVTGPTFQLPPSAPLSGRSGRDVLIALAVAVGRSLLVEVGRAIPFGFLAVLALPAFTRWRERVLRCWLPGLLVSLAAAFLALWWLSDAGPPSLLWMVMPGGGCLIGSWAGMAWRRGWRGRLWFLPQLALVLVLVEVGVLALAWRTLERQPLAFTPPEVTSYEKRRLYALFSRRNPLKLRDGQSATLKLVANDLNLVAAWGVAATGVGHDRKVEVELAAGSVELRVSARMPVMGRYLNLVARGGVAVQDGRLSLRGEGLRVGPFELPRRLIKWLAPLVAERIDEAPRLRVLLDPVQRLAIEEATLDVTYGRAHLPPGFLADLFHGDQGDGDEALVRDYLTHLVTRGAGASEADARFGHLMQAAFAHAAAGSRDGSAVQQNRGAVLALGILVGHRKIEAFIGEVMDDALREAVRRAARRTTLRGREDWPRHFFVSAALTTLAIPDLSDAAGLLKEEKDAGGGSGFSFADLLADRAGTRLAQVATRDEASARGLHQRLARGFVVDDFFPTTAGLPEGLQQAQLVARYGGVGGPGYVRLLADIERRLAACPAYADAR